MTHPRQPATARHGPPGPAAARSAPESPPMSNLVPGDEGERSHVAPGESHDDERSLGRSILGYAVGLVLAGGLTLVSFYIAHTTLFWTPSIPIALSVLAIAQMGVHLVFFLHMTSGPDNVNNLMALAFGVLIVMLLVFGSLWIMSNLNHNMMPMDKAMQMQR